MFKKTIKYKNFDNEEITRDFYFHMSKAELLDLAADGNAMQQRIAKIIADNNGKAILREFRVLITGSCGIKSDDGQRFLKTPEAQSQLLDSPAYDELLMELCTNAEAASEFVSQLLPQQMAEEMAKQIKGESATQQTPQELTVKIQEIEDAWPAWKKEQRNPTEEELHNMSTAELQEVFRDRINKKL